MTARIDSTPRLVRVSSPTPVRRSRLDPFLVAILAAAVVASVFPATGPAVPVVDWASRIMIALLFFVYGVRLRPAETIAGLKIGRAHV